MPACLTFCLPCPFSRTRTRLKGGRVRRCHSPLLPGLSSRLCTCPRLCSMALFYSLRWGDALWCPPCRLVTIVDKGAVVGVCLRTKITKRSMPFAFLLSGLTGSASSSWATRYITVLRQVVADTLASQPGWMRLGLPSVCDLWHASAAYTVLSYASRHCCS